MERHLLQEFFVKPRFAVDISRYERQTVSLQKPVKFRHLIRYTGYIPDMYVKQASALGVI